MKFNIEQKGQQFLVVGDFNGSVYGSHKEKAEAQLQQKTLQKKYDSTTKRIGVSADAYKEIEE